MSILVLLLIVLIAFLSVVLTFVFIESRGTVRKAAQANSPEARLTIPNVWTEIQQVRNAGSIQRMRMRDGNFILLSVGYDTVKVMVSPTLASIESFTELASFGIGPSQRNRRQQEASILNDLRKKIGFPKSLNELSQKLQKFPSAE